MASIWQGARQPPPTDGHQRGTRSMAGLQIVKEAINPLSCHGCLEPAVNMSAECFIQRPSDKPSTVPARQSVKTVQSVERVRAVRERVALIRHVRNLSQGINHGWSMADKRPGLGKPSLGCLAFASKTPSPTLPGGPLFRPLASAYAKRVPALRDQARRQRKAQERRPHRHRWYQGGPRR